MSIFEMSTSNSIRTNGIYAKKTAKIGSEAFTEYLQKIHTSFNIAKPNQT